jgi:alpha-L-fucosidase
MTRLAALVLLLTATLPLVGRQAHPPTPLAPVPTASHLAWHRMETNAFVHFGPNTFTAEEWGTGREDPQVFNPTDFDVRQWVDVFKRAGMRGVIITAKHHDGFCLWPSKLSTHTVAKSPWRGGQGDVLRELADACREAGLAFGVYLSPWDRNHPTYGTPEYNQVFAGMLEEVLGSYDPIFEVWFDGANGEGPNGKRQEYDWPLFHRTVRRLQPNALIFSDAGPGVRWVGNERGESPLTSWSMIDASRYEPGTPLSDELGEGSRLGADWVPAECDVSIRPGWFYKASEDRRVKSARTLFRLYEQSVGRNCVLLLNVPPDTRGRIHERDAESLEGMRALVDRVYGRNLAAGASATADRSRGPGFEPARLVDGDPDTYWAAPDGAIRATITIELPEPRRFDRVAVREHLPLGQRVALFEVEARLDGAWRRIATGTTIGSMRSLQVPPTTSGRLRITIHEARACPAIAEVSLHSTEL